MTQISKQAKASKTLLCVIVSDAHSEQLKKITQTAVDGCHKSGVSTVVYVVEGQKGVNYKGAEVVYNEYKREFNYNRSLNKGVKHALQKYKVAFIAFLNNDIVPSDKWGINLISEMIRLNCGSGSPKCPKRHPDLNKSVKGYKVGRHFCGWAFVLSIKAFLQIKGLSTIFNYWCSDNMVAYQLELEYIQHCITDKSVVLHLGNESGKHIPKDLMTKYTWLQAERFTKLTGKEIFPKELIQMNLNK